MHSARVWAHCCNAHRPRRIRKHHSYRDESATEQAKRTQNARPPREWEHNGARGACARAPSGPRVRLQQRIPHMQVSEYRRRELRTVRLRAVLERPALPDCGLLDRPRCRVSVCCRVERVVRAVSAAAVHNNKRALDTRPRAPKWQGCVQTPRATMSLRGAAMRLLGRDNALARDAVRSGLLRDEGTPMQRLQPAPQDDVRGPPPIGDVDPAPYQEPPVPETQDSFRDAHENIWYAGVTLAILLLVAAVVLGGILWGRVDSHASHQSLDAICNTGSNAGSGLGGCENAPAVPGAPLLSAHASSPEHVLVNRINGAVGINATVEDGAVQISADVVSESSGLVVGVGPGDELTLSLDLPAVNVTPFNVTCCENYFVHQPNALLGYGMALGTDHIFADDNSHPGAAILSGYVNAIIGASGSVIAGGRYNTIDSTFCSLIGAGRNNTIIAPRAAIVIGQYNLVASGQSIVGAGQNNTIDSSLLANAILAGEENVVLESERSVIGVGYQCHIETSSDSGIYSGKENAIYDSVMCFVGSGQTNFVFFFVVF